MNVDVVEMRHVRVEEFLALHFAAIRIATDNNSHKIVHVSLHTFGAG